MESEQSQRIRGKKIQHASLVAIIGNGALSLVKIAAGMVFRSLAVIGDGIDSLGDVVSSFISYFTARIITRPPDAKHPFGHARAENIATKVLSFLVFFAGIQLGLSSVNSLLNPSIRELPSIYVLVAAGISIAGKVMLGVYLNLRGNKLESPMLTANGKNMFSDVLISFGIFIGIGLSILFQLPILDPITAILVSLWIMKTGISIFVETTSEVMDGVDDKDVYDKIFESVAAVENAHNPHRTRVRQIGNQYVIDLDIEVPGEKTVLEGHEISIQVENEIRNKIYNIFDIMVHVEPEGNVAHREGFGLSEHSTDQLKSKNAPDPKK
ncbi:MAG: cation diffusion facilitator family transporter [Spirochaetia bacterium]